MKVFLTFIIIILILAAGVASATGLVQIPVLNSLLGTDKPKDLGVVADKEIFIDSLLKYSVTLEGDMSKYCLTCDLNYGNYQAMDISLNSNELSSYLTSVNSAGPLSRIQIKLGDNGQAEMSAWVNLKQYGYNYSGPVYAAGTIEKNGNGVKINLDNAKLGLLPVPAKYLEKGTEGLQNMVDRQLRQMSNLRVDQFSINNGQLNFQGMFPTKITAK